MNIKKNVLYFSLDWICLFIIISFYCISSIFNLLPISIAFLTLSIVFSVFRFFKKPCQLFKKINYFYTDLLALFISAIVFCVVVRMTTGFKFSISEYTIFDVLFMFFVIYIFFTDFKSLYGKEDNI